MPTPRHADVDDTIFAADGRVISPRASATCRLICLLLSYYRRYYYRHDSAAHYWRARGDIIFRLFDLDIRTRRQLIRLMIRGC